MKVALLFLFSASILLAQDAAQQFRERYGMEKQPTPGVPLRAISSNAPVAIRIVNGKAYAPSRSTLWHQIRIECISVQTNRLAQVQEFSTRSIYGSATGNGAIGAYGYSRPIVGSKEEYGKKFFLTNFPPSLATGAKTYIQAMQSGSVTVGNQVFELWDCGTEPAR